MVLAALLTAPSGIAQTGAPVGEALTIPRLSPRPVIDGIVGEEEWLQATPVSLAWEVRPGHLVAAVVDTTCLLGYDERALYVGCRAYDPDAAAIRAHLADRDSAVRDDYIGIMLDTFNDQRRAFGFFVNPLGVQMDLVRNDAGVDDPVDSSWDTIWSSAGRITADGYQVEFALPFTSLRFQRTGGSQIWGVYLERGHPRSVYREFGSVAIDRDRNCFVCQFAMMTGFEEAEPGRNLELTPTITGSKTEARDGFPNGPLRALDEKVELGVTALWGVTPNLTLAGAVNPDFSQVEADEAQLEVNRRFALFFEEKRPFFLEGADFFDTFFDAVHTRTVVDPDWGAKLSGKEGRSAVGAFVAEDAVTTILIPGSQRSFLTSLDRSSIDAVARYRGDVGAGSALGVLLTGRRGEDYSSTLAGFDGFLRITASHSLQVQVLGSETEYPDELAARFGQPEGAFDGMAYRIRLEHDSRDLFWTIRYDDVGEGFRADMGFMPQVGYRQYGVGGQRSWWGDDQEWYTRLFFGASLGREEDQRGELLYEGGELWTGFNGPLQSRLRYELSVRTRGFMVVEFDEAVHHLEFEIRPSAAFDFDLEARYGDDIDFERVRPGVGLRVAPWMTVRLGRRLQLGLSHELERFDVNGERLYEVNLSELRAVYQFTTRAFVRAILQYEELERDPELYDRVVTENRKKLFTQMLFSYKINPRTVLFFGYSDNHLGTEAFDLAQLDRTVFLKVGYAFVF
jgi:hypothetical protein